MSGDEREDDLVVDRLAPAESFKRLSHAVRIRTLRTLDADGPLRHAALRERVGVDDPGRFNYHLQKLGDQFVANGDEGYRLTPAGRRVVGAIESGEYTGDLIGETIPSDADCLRCGGRLDTHVEDGRVYVSCRDCDTKVNSVDIPAIVLESTDIENLYSVLDRWVKRRLASTQYGFCHRCNGPIETALVSVDDEAAWEGRHREWATKLPVEALYRATCPHCNTERHAMIPAVAVLQPAVVGFHHEHGIDVRSTPLTDLDWLEMGVASITNTDPLAVSVPITLDEETLSVIFDADVSLVDERRS